MSRKRDQVDPALAAMLKDRREAASLPMWRVAEELDLSVTQIQKYESAQTALTTVRLREFVALLGFDPLPFVTPQEPAHSPYPTLEHEGAARLHEDAEPFAAAPRVATDAEEEQVLARYRALSPPLRGAVLALLATLAEEAQAAGAPAANARTRGSTQAAQDRSRRSGDR
ncbi:helix-turn-helix domain-containing protein [Zavarzinia sp. CC-PAN008]|uniref:helix-turn-helix domain-containing protein n=1 Tax=Zavarzinia sp. CC-PAN008 TaxID=3243332 RepID=UPI003F7423AF